MGNQPDQAEPKTVNENSSPLWGRNAKTIVVIIILLLTGLAAWRFQGLLVMTVTAGVVAYIFNPLIIFVNKRTRLARGWVILIIYLTLATVVIWLSIVLGFAAYDQIRAVIFLIPTLIDRIATIVESLPTQTELIIIGPVQFTPVQLPWDSITNQILSLVEPTISTSGQFLGQVASTTVRTLGNFLFVFILSVYLVYEFPKLGGYIGRIANQPGYQRDAERLTKEFGRIWSAYLRGQVILGVIIFLAVWLGLSILGVRNALGLGILSGLLEFVPNVGPVVGAGAAVLVALFQTNTPYGLESWQFALIVLGLMILIQQIENNFLVPRIVGGALDLHPIVVIMGVLMGASLAGVLGAILAAPILATLKLLGVYTWRKLFDLPPFPEENYVTDSPVAESPPEIVGSRETAVADEQPSVKNI